MDNRTKAYLSLLTTALLWGVAPPIIKYSLNYVTPVEFLFLRFLLVSLIVLPFFILNIIRNPFKTKDRPLLILTSLCGTSITLGLLFYGLQKTTALDSAVLAALSPLLIVAAGEIFLKEKLTSKEKAGIFFAFLGTLIAIASPIFSGGKMFHGENLIGNLLIFLSTLSWTAYSIISKKLTKKYSSFNITSLSFIIGLISFLPLFLVEKAGYFAIDARGLPGILYMSIFGSLIAYFTYTYGFSKIKATEASIFTYLQPVFTVPLAVLWLKEDITGWFALGAVFIVIGVFLAELHKERQSNSCPEG